MSKSSGLLSCFPKLFFFQRGTVDRGARRSAEPPPPSPIIKKVK
jgi:hypothetical protein